ncbi:MAG: von Willebrand factor type A domain-containing protein [Bacteroidota bacterium]
MKKLALSIPLLLLLPALLLAQSGIIKGQVTELETGRPLVYAAVALFENGTARKVRETVVDGNYVLNTIPTGVYSLEVHYLGFETFKMDSISVKEDEIITLNIGLEKKDLTLEAVVVREYRMPVIKKDCSYSVTTLESDHISVRGSRNSATNYYIDGKRVQGQLSGSTTAPASPQLSKQGLTPAATSQESQSANEFGQRVENSFLSPEQERFSTFGVDVDRAAYSIVRSYLQRGQMPPAQVVRTEEMVNYFEYDYLQPEDEHPFAVHSEIAVCPWDAEHLLLSVALQGEHKSLQELPLSNLTFLLDVSGSMGAANKLPLVKQSIEFLLDRLRPEDQVAFVVYAGAAGVVLPPTKVAEKETILTALQNLKSGGSTAGGRGIRLAYELAREYFVEDGNNRVVLATDGDFNVGISSESALEALIEEEKKSGVFLTTLGFGFGNLKDNRLERLADKGNGMYAYIDTPEEAHKVFGEELTGSLYTIAKDVKLQLEFSPKSVKSYRLVGYENRLLAKEDFDDDTKDAGEIGAGHSVTAIYEIIPNTDVEQQVELGRLELRYKQPDEDQSQLMVHELTQEVRSFEATSCNFRWATAIAAYSLVLQDSKYAGMADMRLVQQLAESALGDDPYGIRAAFLHQLPTTEEVMARINQP